MPLSGSPVRPVSGIETRVVERPGDRPGVGVDLVDVAIEIGAVETAAQVGQAGEPVVRERVGRRDHGAGRRVDLVDRVVAEEGPVVDVEVGPVVGHVHGRTGCSAASSGEGMGVPKTPVFVSVG